MTTTAVGDGEVEPPRWANPFGPPTASKRYLITTSFFVEWKPGDCIW